MLASSPHEPMPSERGVEVSCSLIARSCEPLTRPGHRRCTMGPRALRAGELNDRALRASELNDRALRASELNDRVLRAGEHHSLIIADFAHYIVALWNDMPVLRPLRSPHANSVQHAFNDSSRRSVRGS